jgi:hypothetical protein
LSSFDGEKAKDMAGILNRQHMENLVLKLIFDLHGIGVNVAEVSIQEEESCIRIEFPWQYHGDAVSKKRSVTLISADITKPSRYPPSLRKKLSEGIDIFYMKGAFAVPFRYHEFLPQVAQSIRSGGWLMTTDKTMTMDLINPETC